jgi:ribose transport system ATP-binding protein
MKQTGRSLEPLSDVPEGDRGDLAALRSSDPTAQTSINASPGRVVIGPSVALRLTNLSKSFSTTRVLREVTMDVRSGEVHALIGQNGSGKSTLIKILAGYHRADAGSEALLHGAPLELGSQRSARRGGLRFVHQDLGLVNSLSVAENFALGSGFVAARSRTIDWTASRVRCEEALRALGVELDARRLVSSLNASERVILGLARAIDASAGEPSVLFLDEPTAALPPPEVRILFDAVRSITASGIPVVYVSHRLDEVLQIADRVTVLRDGVRTHRGPVDGLTIDELVNLLLGATYEAPKSAQSTNADRDDGSRAAVATASHLRGKIIQDFSLEVSRGEILGVMGLTGSGREELADLLSCTVPLLGGSVTVDGHELKDAAPGANLGLGVARLPAERLVSGLVPGLSVRENLSLQDFSGIARRGLISLRRERKEAEKWISAFHIKPAATEAMMSNLSGGNQQKVLIARLIRTTPKLLILEEPTQGVDVQAKSEIHEIIREVASEGMAVVVCSTDLDEVAALCDRILILRDGRISQSFVNDSLDADFLERKLHDPSAKHG